MRVKKLAFNIIIFVSFMLCASTLAWGRSIISGKVVDAQTDEPIKGAAVFIYWGKSGSGPPGLAAETVRVEVAEDLTDDNGNFSIPKYWTWFKHYHMAIYKKGYVCWSSRKIFPSFEERSGFELKDSLIIKLEHFKPEYSKKKHAFFILGSSTQRPTPGLFDNAIESEIKLLRWSTKENK
jgi:hypothetical protein